MATNQEQCLVVSVKSFVNIRAATTVQRVLFVELNFRGDCHSCIICGLQGIVPRKINLLVTVGMTFVLHTRAKFLM